MIKELKPVVAELSAKLQEHISVNKDTGAGAAPDDIYDTTLPEGITPDLVKKVSTHNSNFVAAAVHAFGSKAVEALGQNDGINQASMDIRMGYKDNLHVQVTGQMGMGEDKVEYGVTESILTTHAGGNGGQVKVAMAHIAELADNAFNKDKIEVAV